MTVNIENQQEVTEQAHKMIDENLLILLEESKDIEESNEITNVPLSSSEDSPPVYFRYFLIYFETQF